MRVPRAPTVVGLAEMSKRVALVCKPLSQAKIFSLMDMRQEVKEQRNLGCQLTEATVDWCRDHTDLSNVEVPVALGGAPIGSRAEFGRHLDARDGTLVRAPPWRGVQGWVLGRSRSDGADSETYIPQSSGRV